MTKKSFKDLIRDAGKNAAQQAREKKRKREEDATRPQIAAPGTKEGLTEPAAGTPDSTRQMTPLDKELALAQDEAAARKDKREKGKWETNPTMQMDALTEQAVLEQDQALADASTAPSPESKVLDDILESGAVEEEEVVVSTATEDLDQPLDGVVAEPPTLTNEKAMTEEEAAQIAEPPTMSKEAMTEQEAAQIAEPPTITEKEKVDDSILREIEDDVFGAAAKTDDVFAPLAETGEDIFSALAETEVPAVAEGSQSVAVEESYQLLTEKVEKPERESELPSPAKTGRKGWLSYYLSEVFLGITSVAAAVTAAVYAGSLSVTMAAVLVGYMALSGTMAALSAMGKRRTRQQNEVSRGVNDEY
jgi:hypothetical protein